MAETPTPAPGAPAPKNGAANETSEVTKSAVRPAKETAKAAEAVGETLARSFDAAADKGAQTAEVVAGKTAEATDKAAATAAAVSEKAAEARDAAAKASGEILLTQAETVQGAVSSGLETGMKSLQDLAQTWSRSFGLAGSSLELAEASSRNMKAVSQASTALAKGAQDASRAWFELTRNTARTNIEALGQLSQAKTLPELVALQSNLIRDNLGQAIAAGEEVARVSTAAIREATRALQPAV